MLEPTATIELHRLLSKAVQNAFTAAELAAATRRLSRIAMETGHAGTLFRMGEVLEEQGKTKEAVECWRRAGEEGVGEAWVRVGRIYLKTGKRGEAEEAFERGRELGLFMQNCSDCMELTSAR
jgi:tetratricopeptide (TPR) repeat protein